MKKMMLLIVPALMMFTAPAHAGARFDGEVRVTLTSDSVKSGGLASGGVLAARHSDDDVQFIGCSQETGGSGHEPLTRCFARDREGVTLQCRSNDSQINRIVATIGATSYIEFNVPVAGGQCGYVRVENASWHGPTP